MYIDKFCGSVVRILKWDSGCEDLVIRVIVSYLIVFREITFLEIFTKIIYFVF